MALGDAMRSDFANYLRLPVSIVSHCIIHASLEHTEELPRNDWIFDN